MEKIDRKYIEDLLKKIDELSPWVKLVNGGPYGVWMDEETIHAIADVLRVEMEHTRERAEEQDVYFGHLPKLRTRKGRPIGEEEG